MASSLDVYSSNHDEPFPSGLSSGEMKLHLQTLLDGKEKQLQQAGMLGQRVLAQQTELEDRIRQLQELEGDGELGTETRGRYQELAEVIEAWDAENAELSSTFGLKRTLNGAHPPPLPHSDAPREEPERKVAAASTSAAQSRRAKNAAHRAGDAELAFEIGSGLLTEVRRLQSLLGERDKAIQDMKEEKDDLDKTIDSLRTALRAQEQNADKYKEENWNLEVTLQEIRTQLSDTQASAQRLDNEQKRLTRLLATSRDTSEQHQNEAERLRVAYDELKAKHETDVVQGRKVAAGLQRDKTELQSTVDKLKAEAAMAARRLPVFGVLSTPNGPASNAMTPGRGEEDVFSTGGAPSTTRRRIDNTTLFPPADLGSDFADSSPDASPSKSPGGKDIETLQQRLAHAHRQINALNRALLKEKELRMDYKKKFEVLSSGQGSELGADDDYVEVDEEDEDILQSKPSPGSKGKTRRRGGMTLMQRLSMAAREATSSPGDGSSIPPKSPISITFEGEDDEGLEYEEEDEAFDIGEYPDEQTDDPPRSPSPSDSAGKNRISSEGMDPAYAHVLRRAGSVARSSPLRNSILARQARRKRGGAAYQAGRPPSFVARPEALGDLADELGLGDDDMSLQDDLIEEEDTMRPSAECGCQTDLEFPTPTRDTNDMAVQADVAPSEPEVVLVRPAIIKAEVSTQTDDESVERIDRSIQYDLVEPSLVFASAAVNTDPEAVPEQVQAQVQTEALQVSEAEVQAQPPLAEAGVGVSRPSSSVTVGAAARPQSRELATAVEEDEDEEDEDEPFERERRTTLVPGDITKASIATMSRDNTLRQSQVQQLLASRRPLTTPADGDETGTETETDMEEYHDARQSIAATPTPSQSTDDFHSVLTMSDNELDVSDDDSIKVSRFPTSALARPSERPPSSQSVRLPYVSYESRGVSAEPPPEPPKPEMKTVSVQTEPAKPSSGFGLYKVGAGPQQFQFIAPPPPPVPASSTSSWVGTPTTTARDSSATFGVRPGSVQSEISRQATEASVSTGDAMARSRAHSGTLPPPIDKTRPPTMAVPPPPRMPPPPGSMAPPQFIPERKNFPPQEWAPPRPSSPPPPELVQRATTPTARGGYGIRQTTTSQSSSQPGLRQPASTSSFRSAANAAAAYAQHGQAALSIYSSRDAARKGMSSTSLVSDRSSISSDHQHYPSRDRGKGVADVSVSPSKPSVPGGATDPNVIHAITQTMIGEFLWKYTRRTIGKGHAQTRHRRFFWVHPYTKTLYWSSGDPGSSNVSEQSAKSAYIEGVRSVLDPNPMPPGLYQHSVIISTPQREMKITAPTKERHDIWLEALKYLLARPNAQPASPGNPIAVPDSPSSARGGYVTDEDHRYHGAKTQSQRGAQNARQVGTWTAPSTPRGQRNRSQISIGGSVGKRSGTAALEYLRFAAPEGPYSPTKEFAHLQTQDSGELDFELHADVGSDEGFEGLENVRACCDGRHTVGHHHHHAGDPHLDPHPNETPRPTSPSWSLRARTVSGNSQEGASGSNMFSWGREEGRRRFGTRRSAKSTTTDH